MDLRENYGNPIEHLEAQDLMCPRTETSHGVQATHVRYRSREVFADGYHVGIVNDFDGVFRDARDRGPGARGSGIGITLSSECLAPDV